MAAIVLSSLPYFHDIISTEEGLKNWVPDLGIQKLLTDATDRIVGYSSYRVFLYIFLSNVLTLAGYLLWYRVSKNKTYHKAILIPLLLTAYNIGIILLNLRGTWYNEVLPKVILITFLAITLFYFSSRQSDKKNILSSGNILVWFGFALLSTSLFFHDIITDRQGDIKSWIPNLGIENLLANGDGTIKDFGNYRIFLFFLMLHLSPHLAWVGAFFDAISRLYRPFILVPVISTLYAVAIIFLGARQTGYNEPDVKFYIAIGVSFLVALNFFYNNVYLSKTLQKSKPPKSFEHKINP